ncbi:alpha/beta fold hydrolase [Streptomyces sp. NPDC088354]|uniref:alpha/beta fold hydrolase n=1 Tax=Streptomyces sp. NPDC088354 TaxID=3365856 RepID=UPI00380A5F99
MTYGDSAEGAGGADGGAASHTALVPYALPDRPAAAVLLLHGGRAEGLEPPTRWNLPGARMRPFVRAIGRATAGHCIALAGVRYRHRGWNGDRQDAARDAWRALEALRGRAGTVPVVLVGHSMGGRAALRVAGHPLVGGVVGLAPWCPAGEPVGQLAGRRLVLLHGDRDRVTDPAASLVLADRARAAGALACHLTVPGGDHAMLRDAGTWHATTARVVAGLLRLAPLPPDVASALAATGAGKE